MLAHGNQHDRVYVAQVRMLSGKRLSRYGLLENYIVVQPIFEGVLDFSLWPRPWAQGPDVME